MTDEPRDTSGATLGVGMVGYAFMGAAHSQAWRAAHRFFDLPMTPRMAALCGRDAERLAAAATKLGWESTEQDWRTLLAREDIDLVDICTPGDTHAEIAVAALEAGKHVLCEKPLANTVAEAQRMTAAAETKAVGLGEVMAGLVASVPLVQVFGPAGVAVAAVIATGISVGLVFPKTCHVVGLSVWHGLRTIVLPTVWRHGPVLRDVLTTIEKEG